MATRDGTIVYVAECHCFGCGQGAMGLGGGAVMSAQDDLRDRGWVRIKRRWHCPDCAKDRRP